jgi:hypothetical protein
VQFLEGDRAQPVITGFGGKGTPGYVPTTLTLCDGTLPAARQGDLVQSGGTGTLITLAPTPATPLLPGILAPALGIGLSYYVSFSAVPPTALSADPLYGAVSIGSSKVRCG